MAADITMPALSSTMKEGKIVQWTKGEGDKISSGDVVMVVESDKVPPSPLFPSTHTSCPSPSLISKDQPHVLPPSSPLTRVCRPIWTSRPSRMVTSPRSSCPREALPLSVLLLP